MKIQESTSIKELFQNMIPESMQIIRGLVKQESPLEIQVIGDDKLVLHKNIIVVPSHLTDYTTKCDIELGDGAIDSKTEEADEHIHELETFNIYKAKIKIYNALKVGEVVYILSFNGGKKYYLLDREEAKL